MFIAAACSTQNQPTPPTGAEGFSPNLGALLSLEPPNQPGAVLSEVSAKRFQFWSYSATHGAATTSKRPKRASMSRDLVRIISETVNWSMGFSPQKWTTFERRVLTAGGSCRFGSCIILGSS